MFIILFRGRPTKSFKIHSPGLLLVGRRTVIVHLIVFLPVCCPIWSHEHTWCKIMELAQWVSNSNLIFYRHWNARIDNVIGKKWKDSKPKMKWDYFFFYVETSIRFCGFLYPRGELLIYSVYIILYSLDQQCNPNNYQIIHPIFSIIHIYRIYRIIIIPSIKLIFRFDNRSLLQGCLY